MRCGFAGTPAFAARILEHLIGSHHDVTVVFTQPDKPAGRGRRAVPSAVRVLAETADIAVRTPTRLGSASVLSELERLDLDVLVVAAYGLILPQTVLDIPRHGCINVHASLLPRWRGAAPIERAIMAGDCETGVAITRMEAGLDTGPVYRERRYPITDEDTGDSLHAALAELGAECLLEVLDGLPGLEPTAQDDSLATYAEKLTAADRLLNFSADAASLARRIRALNSRLPVTVELGSERVWFLRASAEASSDGDTPPGTIVAADKSGIRIRCGEGQLRVTEVKLSRGKGRPMSAAAAVNGFPTLFTPGRSFATRADG